MSLRKIIEVAENAVQELQSAAASGKMTTDGKYMGKLVKIVLISSGNSGIGLTAKWFVCLISSQFGNNFIVLFQYEY
jgi:citrate lyase synthetase